MPTTYQSMVSQVHRIVGLIPWSGIVSQKHKSKSLSRSFQIRYITITWLLSSHLVLQLNPKLNLKYCHIYLKLYNI